MKVVPYLVNYNIFEIYRSSTTPDIQTECSLLERDSGIALLYHLQMSESGSFSDEGSPSSSSRFEPAMSGFSWPLLESGMKETLDDPYNCQTLANIGSSSMLVGEGVVCDAIPIFRSDPHNCQTLANIGSSSMLVGEGVVCDAIPIFCSEFTVDHLENNLLDSEKQLEALRRSCSIPRSVGIRLVRREELPSELPKGEPSFHQWRYCYKMRPVKACTGYAECACRSERERVVFDKRKAYCTWKKCWCFLYNDWEHAKGVTPERCVPTHFQTVGTRGTIKLSGQELADVEKVLRVPKEDRHLVEKVGKKVETSTKKRRVPMSVPSEDILFHKEARKHRVRPIIKTRSREEVLKVTASKKVEVEAIRCAAAIVAVEDRRLLPHLPTINPIFPPIREHIGQKGDPSSSNEGKDKEEVGSVPWKDLKHYFGSDDRLVMQVMAEYHDRLKEAERCKRRNGENLKLKVQLEATKKQLETIMLEVSKVKGELDSALVEVSELKSSIPTEKEAAVKEFLGSQTFLHVLRLCFYSNSADEFGDEASTDEQSHQGDDEFGDAKNGGMTQSDMIRGSTSDEDD
ncbi:unnamed protein product [Malus baccata var. baccata]